MVATANWRPSTQKNGRNSVSLTNIGVTFDVVETDNHSYHIHLAVFHEIDQNGSLFNFFPLSITNLIHLGNQTTL